MNIQPIYAKPFEFCCVVISLTIVALTAVLADSPLFADATVRIRQTKTNKQFPAPIKNPFANRFIKYDRKKWRDYNAKIMELGSSQATQAGIAKGLHWLVRTQHSSGAWKLDGKFKNPGAKNDIAGTALGLLPFLGVGKTHKASKTNPFDIPVKNGLLFLLKKQDKKTGYFGGGMYAHSMATMAICETYALTKDLNARRPAQHAIEYLIKAQHPGGGWRYKPGQAGDMSVSGWAIQAITTGKLAGLNVPDATLRKAVQFLDSVRDPRTEGYGYISPDPTTTMTAAALLCRQRLQGWDAKHPKMRRAIENYIKKTPPGKVRDAYYYFYATQVMHNLGGEEWKWWNKKMRKHLVNTQGRVGSWDPKGDRIAMVGGRLVHTALCVLTLEVYFRYVPMHQNNNRNGETARPR